MRSFILWLATLGAADADWASALRQASADAPASSVAEGACRAAWAAAVVTAPDSAPIPRSADERAALAAARRAGPIRVYGAVEGSVLRIGLVDPLDVVGRIEAFVRTSSGERIPLTRGSERARRLPPGVAGTVELVAIARDCPQGHPVAGGAVPIRSTTSTLTAAPPPAPTLLPPPAAIPAPEAVVEGPAPFAWWWYAALGVAAAGLGLAVWEEAR